MAWPWLCQTPIRDSMGTSRDLWAAEMFLWIWLVRLDVSILSILLFLFLWAGVRKAHWFTYNERMPIESNVNARASNEQATGGHGKIDKKRMNQVEASSFLFSYD